MTFKHSKRHIFLLQLKSINNNLRKTLNLFPIGTFKSITCYILPPKNSSSILRIWVHFLLYATIDLFQASRSLDARNEKLLSKKDEKEPCSNIVGGFNP